ncbi:MAG: hypothetical protein MSC31_18560 [Solirubrobacteraceae bacterium MAG38_C4-C5]|nr:hypothetical protein [Candidatus Siliceabacter maunaloa]
MLSRFFARLLFAVAVLAVLYGPGGSTAVAIEPVESPGSLDEANRGDGRWEAAQKRARERLERRRGPAAQRERGRSRTEFRGLGREEALGLAREHFPDLLRGPLFSGREPAGGMEVVKQLGGGRALVEDQASGRELLAISSVPLQATTDGGRSRRSICR